MRSLQRAIGKSWQRTGAVTGGAPFRWHASGGNDSEDTIHGALDSNSDIPKDARRVIVAGAGINVGLGVSKFLAGTAAGSPALIADGVHSLTDIVSDAVTYITMKVARLPADSNHLFGHGRVEPLGTLAVAALLVGASGGVAMHSYGGIMVALPLLDSVPDAQAIVAQASLTSILSNNPQGVAAVGVAVASILSKEALYRWTALVAKRVSSTTLMANAWHHRSDAWSSVVAAIGVGASLCGFPLLDPLGGMLVAGLIGKQGLDMGSAALRELSDEAADAETVANLQQALEEAAPGEIRRVQRLRTRVMGHYIAAEAVLSMRPNATLTEADMVRRMAAAAVKSACPQVLDLSLSIVPQHTAPIVALAQLATDATATVTDADSSSRETDHTHTPSRLPRVIGKDVQRRVLRGVAGVARVTHMRLHFAPDGATCVAEFEIDVSDPIMRVQDVWEVASRARMLAEQVPEVTEADVHLELRDNLLVHDNDDDGDHNTRRQ